MTVKPIEVRAFQIEGAIRLDAIRVFIQDYGGGLGRIVIECYGRAWSNYWNGMGEKTTMEDFFKACDDDYLVQKLSNYKMNREDTKYLTRIVQAVKNALPAPTT